MQVCLSVGEMGGKWVVYACPNVNKVTFPMKWLDSEEAADAWIDQQCKVKPDMFYTESSERAQHEQK